jgi:hypothetical protein
LYANRFSIPFNRTHGLFYAILGSITVAFLCVVIFTDGTAGNGDSLCHYLIARGAAKNHALFFDHWGKPLFTLLSFPFAQLGFTAVKCYNVLAMSIACAAAYHTAYITGIKRAWLTVLFFFFASEVIEVTPSAFTEPTFALVLAVAILLISSNRLKAGLIVLSFLPFARTEGLFILPLAAVFLYDANRISLWPWLLTGHVVISLMGYPYHDSILWVFTENPYARTELLEGERHWHYFPVRMYYLIGPISCFVLIAGILHTIYKYLKSKKTVQLRLSFWLICGSFLVVFTAHSIFWTFGMFGSIGLTRVIMGTMPCIAILCAAGFNVVIYPLYKLQSNATEYVTIGLLFLALFYFTFLNTPTAADLKSDFTLNEGQQFMAHQLSPYIKQKYTDNVFYFSDPALSHFLNQNLYDSTAFQLFYKKPDYRLNANEVVIWDEYWSFNLHSMSLDTLLSKPYLKLDTCLIHSLSNNSTMKYCVFVAREDSVSTFHK